MSWFYATPVAIIAVLAVLFLLIALELGHRLSRISQAADQQITAIAAPILALVGLLLAFSFSMASERLALRRAAGVQEANSIGTFWLRTALLPEPTRSEMRARLRRYVDLHFEHREAVLDEDRTKRAEAEVAQLQEELWTLLMQDTHGAPVARRHLLLTPALNSMLDDTASMIAARENRLPDAIFMYLFLLVFSAGVVVAYRPQGEKRNILLWVIFTGVLSGVLIILIDIDRPRRGLIQTDMTPFTRLRQSMQGR